MTVGAGRTRSQIGKASRNKGAAFERAVARALREAGYCPDAKRSRDNGSAWTADTGDLAGTDEHLYWSCKDVARAQTGREPGLVAGWMAEALDKAGDRRFPLLVVKRAGHADPLLSWCWLYLGDLVGVATMQTTVPTAPEAPVRMVLRDVLELLATAGYAEQPVGVGRAA